MKYEKWLTGLVAAVLAALLSYGVVGAMVTAFDLPVAGMGLLMLTCVAVSALCALCFQIRRGSAVLLCIAALLTGFLWRGGAAVEQTMSLLYQISKFYDSAYGWGIFYYGSGAGLVDYPMGILGALVAVAVCWTVCRRQSIWPAAAAVLVPLCACLVVTDTVPSEGYLYLILLGFLILVMTNGVRRKDGMQGITLTAIVSAPLALALALAFWLIPRESYVNRAPEFQQQAMDVVNQIPELWEQINTPSDVDIAPDQAEKVDLSAVGPRPDNTFEIMDVIGTVNGALYLRGQDYDYYSGVGWTSTLRNSEPFPGSADALEVAGAVTVETKRVRDLIYFPYYPTESVDLMGGKLLNSEKIRRYVFTRGVLPEGWQEDSYTGSGLTQAQAYGESQAKERYLSVPEDTKQWARTLLADILSSDMTRTQQAEAIAAFVRDSARYDLDTSRMPGGEADFVRWFISESETGYCVHFATAAAVLLRSADIPARYVTGYMIHAEAGKTSTVTAKEAHAWVEYYEPVLDAWVLLEATPSDSEQPIPEPTADTTEPMPTEATEETAESTAPATKPTEAPTEVSTEPTEPAQIPEKREPLNFGWLWALLIVGLAVAAVPLQRFLRLRLRRRRQEAAGPNALALLLWREARMRARLLDQRPPRELDTLAQKAKFSQHTLTEEELQRFRSYLAEAEATLLAKPWYWQIILRYALAIY